jgi:hypothetical protein
MAAYGYTSVADRGFVGFDGELNQGAWAEIATQAHENAAKNNAAALLDAPRPVVWKLRLRWVIAELLGVLAAPTLESLDKTWDAAQRRLFHHIAIGVDNDDAAVRAAADRLRTNLLSGTGTAQTQLSYEDEVDFGRKQIALTGEGGPLHADAKKVKIGNALADVHKATDSLAQALGRSGGEKRKAPSKRLRDALAQCASTFNAVHDDLDWFIENTPAGANRDRLTALLSPLEKLLERVGPANTETPAAENGTNAP